MLHDFKVTCKGACPTTPTSAEEGKCGMNGSISADGSSGQIQCACDNCKMEVQTKGSSLISNVPPTIKQLPNLFTYLGDYIKTKYNSTAYVLMSVEQQSDEEYTVTTFDYVVSGNIKGSVMYAAKKGGPITQIDCMASQCDCREEFVFTSTGSHAECTCEKDCKMTVTQLPEPK